MTYLVEHVTWTPDEQDFDMMAQPEDEIFETLHDAIEFARRWCRENEFNEAKVYEVTGRWLDDDTGTEHYAIGAELAF